MFQLNNKNETLNILTKYFKKFDPNDLGYYLNNYKGETIPQFLKSNIYDPENIELLNFLHEYLKIVLKKIFYITTPYNIKRGPVKLSFINDLIYWERIFVIENNIFISYDYLIKIFDKIENNDYKSVKDVYISKDKIFDLELLKKLGEAMYYIVQFLNFDYWEGLICEKYFCSFIDKSQINFKNKYKILQEPNTSFIHDKITIYWLYSGEIYALINTICSNLSFSPYWEKKVIKLKYSNGQYTEELEIDKEQIKNTENNCNKFKYSFNAETNPFVHKAKQMTNCSIYS